MERQSQKSILSKTKDLLKHTISSIDNTAYFQTRSASKILMRLAYFDKGLEFIMDIVLQKRVPVAIYNFPMGDHKNILSILIKKKELDFFKLLFNQAVLDYYNGDSIDLFPLFDVLLCFEKDELPGKYNFENLNIRVNFII